MDDNNNELFERLLHARSLGQFSDELMTLFKEGKVLKDLFGYQEQEMIQQYAYASERFQSKEYAAASKIFAHLTLLDPMEMKYWIALGTSESRAGNIDKALTAFSMASLIHPNDPDPYYRAGLCYVALEQDDDALKSFNLALIAARADETQRALETDADRWISKLIGKG